MRHFRPSITSKILLHCTSEKCEINSTDYGFVIAFLLFFLYLIDSEVSFLYFELDISLVMCVILLLF